MKKIALLSALIASTIAGSAVAATATNSLSLSWAGTIPAAPVTPSGDFSFVDASDNPYADVSTPLTIERTGSGADIGLTIKSKAPKVVSAKIATGATGAFTTGHKVYLQSSTLSGLNVSSVTAVPAVPTVTVGGKALTKVGEANGQTIDSSSEYISLVTSVAATVATDQWTAATDKNVTINASIVLAAEIG